MILNSLTIPGHVIFEAGEGHRWQFDYENYESDPNPDVLVLGAYKHPTTGNDLVGGINLHYLGERERIELRKTLPELSKMRGLKSRVRFGRRALPHIFSQQAYRTYNADHITNLKKGVLFPIYGTLAKDPRKSDMARKVKEREIKREPEIVDANKDIRAIEKSYDAEIAKQAAAAPSDPSLRTDKDREVIDRYAEIKKPLDAKKAVEVRSDVEGEYADEAEATKRAATAPAPIVPAKKPVVTPAPVVPSPTSRTQAAAPAPRTLAAPAPVAPAATEPAIAAPVARQDNAARFRDYERQPDLDERIEVAPIEPEEEPARPVAPQEIDTETEGPEVATESIDRKRMITYYSPRLGRYLTEAL